MCYLNRMGTVLESCPAVAQETAGRGVLLMPFPFHIPRGGRHNLILIVTPFKYQQTTMYPALVSLRYVCSRARRFPA